MEKGMLIYQGSGANDRSDALASGPRQQNVERGKSELPEFVAVCLLACVPSICISLCTVHRAAVDVHGGSTPTLVIIIIMIIIIGVRTTSSPRYLRTLLSRRL